MIVTDLPIVTKLDQLALGLHGTGWVVSAPDVRQAAALIREQHEALSNFLVLHENSKQSKNSDTTFIDTRDFEAFCSAARATLAKAREA